MNIKTKLNLAIFLMICLLVITCLNACSQRRNPDTSVNPDNEKRNEAVAGQSDSNKDTSSNADVKYEIDYAYTPLTHVKFQDIRNSVDLFTAIDIYYKKSVNPDQNGHNQYLSRFYLDAGGSFSISHYNDISEYEGTLVYRDLTVPIEKEKFKVFSKDDVNAIFDYLEANHDYFFNGNEYEGLEIPYLCQGINICNANYIFTLSFSDPYFLEEAFQEQYFPAWAISKCIDEVYPDHPLYGLFELLEDDFISQFE
ncbi:hypothetical protein J7L05_06720 [bacterium]|nr:hypothetical protein [bacterium]